MLQARVDVIANPALGKRFGVKSFPTIKVFYLSLFHNRWQLFKQGHVYDYKDKRDETSLYFWATAGYLQEQKQPVPPPLSFV